MTGGFEIQSVTLRSGVVYVLAYLPAKCDHASFVEGLQQAIDPTGKRKVVRAVPADVDVPPPGV